MRLLKIVVKGLTLFKEKINIDFYAEQRVSSNNNEMVSKCFDSVYTNNVISIVGINASGKTSLLKVISFVMEFINGESIHSITNKDVLKESENVIIEVYFLDQEKNVYKLKSEIKNVQDNEMDSRYIVSSECLWRKGMSKVKSKKNLFVFSDDQIFKVRDGKAEFLKDDTSIVLSLNRTKSFYLKDLIQLTNVNFLRLKGNFPHELIAFLDPSIEKISFDEKNKKFKLKFYNREEIIVSHPIFFENYLSSGTIKGINIFMQAMMVLKEGGYLIVDELENHFNREIVATLVRFFMNRNVNKKGATLIFSTHYPELLDEFERNDGIFIVRNKNGISIQKLSEKLTRNDIKKSEAFKSDFLEGTVPSYESYIKLKTVMISGDI